MLSIITCTLVIGTAFTMKQWWEVRGNIEHTNAQRIILLQAQNEILQEQNEMLQEAIDKRIVVVQNFGETTISDEGE